MGEPILKTTHTKTINVAIGIVSQFDKATTEDANKHITYLKAFRGAHLIPSAIKRRCIPKARY